MNSLKANNSSRTPIKESSLRNSIIQVNNRKLYKFKISS